MTSLTWPLLRPRRMRVSGEVLGRILFEMGNDARTWRYEQPCCILLSYLVGYHQEGSHGYGTDRAVERPRQTDP